MRNTVLGLENWGPQVCCVGGGVQGRKTEEWGRPLVPKGLSSRLRVRNPIQGVMKKGKQSRSAHPALGRVESL